MNKFLKIFSFIALTIVVSSCSKSDDSSTEPLRDYSEQYLKDIDSIDNFIDTHYMEVDADFNVTFTKIPSGGTQLSIREQNDYPLTFKMVQNDDHEVNYKVYYLKLREGVNRRPSRADSVHVAYRGIVTSNTQFDLAQQPTWLQLEDLVPGWKEIIPEFKTGTYDTVEGPNPVNFQEYGAGVMFLPSGLGYYNAVPPGGNIATYSPLIFNFKLMELQYKDHDRDGILTRDEVAPGDLTGDIEGYDSDGDDVPNFFDVDDDGDLILTKNEIIKNSDGTYSYPDCNGNGIPNYLDKLDKNIGFPCP